MVSWMLIIFGNKFEHTPTFTQPHPYPFHDPCSPIIAYLCKTQHYYCISAGNLSLPQEK